MHIVVTGATGNIGTSVLEALAADPDVRSITGVARRVPDLKAHKTYFVSANVATEALGPIFEGADAVIHLAWQFQPERRPEEIWSTNVLGSRRVFDAVRHAGVAKLIYASSFAVYAPVDGAEPIDEGFPTTGIATSTYSRHKVEVERRLDEFEYRNPQISVVRLRPCVTLKRSAASEILRRFAGPLVPRAAFGPLAQQMARQLASTGLQVAHTSDVAKAFRLAAWSDVRGAFNIAPRALGAAPIAPEDHLFDSARMVRRAAELAWRFGLHRTDPGWMDLVSQAPALSVVRARQELGFVARYTTEEAVAEALEGLRSGAGLGTPPLRPVGRASAQYPYTAHVSA